MLNTLHQLDYTFLYSHFSIFDKIDIKQKLVLGLLDQDVSIYLEDTEAESILGTGKFTHDKLEEGDETIVLMKDSFVSAFGIYSSPFRVGKVSLLPIKDIYVSPGVSRNSSIDSLLNSFELRASGRAQALLLYLPKEAKLQRLKTYLTENQHFTKLTNPSNKLRRDNFWP